MQIFLLLPAVRRRRGQPRSHAKTSIQFNPQVWSNAHDNWVLLFIAAIRASLPLELWLHYVGLPDRTGFLTRNCELFTSNMTQWTVVRLKQRYGLCRLYSTEFGNQNQFLEFISTTFNVIIISSNPFFHRRRRGDYRQHRGGRGHSHGRSFQYETRDGQCDGQWNGIYERHIECGHL